MSLFSEKKSGSSQIEIAASEWTVRLERGLSADEQDAYTQWLSEDPRHREAMSLFKWEVEELDRLVGIQTTHKLRVDANLLDGNQAPHRNRWHHFTPVLAAAAALVMLLVAIGTYTTLSRSDESQTETLVPEVELMARIEQRTLSDGSTVKLNRRAVLESNYADNIRHVILKGGEATFTVARDPNRPFVVSAGGVEVLAVGTVFNVRFDQEKVDVIVSEGEVKVRDESKGKSGAAMPETSLRIGQRAIVHVADRQKLMHVKSINEIEIDEALIWQPRMLEFDTAPLSNIIQAFNRHNPIKVELGSEALDTIILSSSFWSDDVEGFVRLMETTFNIKYKWKDKRTIVLFKN